LSLDFRTAAVFATRESTWQAYPLRIEVLRLTVHQYVLCGLFVRGRVAHVNSGVASTSFREAIMKAGKRAAMYAALLLAFAGTAFAQGAGGGGGNGGTSAGGAGAGGANGAGQGGAGMSAPNTGGTTGSTSSSKGANTMKSPSGMSKSDPRAKGASDGAASGAQ
jgi:hypothetical protein